MSEGEGLTLSSGLGVDAAVLSGAILDEISEYIVLFDSDFRFVGVNACLTQALGRTAEELLGTSVIELIAPADRDRAAAMLGFTGGHEALPGASAFDLLRGDGSTMTVEITGANVVVAGVSLFAVIGRPNREAAAVDRVLDRLAAGRDLAEVLEPVLDLFAWREAGSRIAIAWMEDLGMRSVSTSLPPALTGRDALDAGLGPNPWADVRRTGVAVRGPVGEVLDRDRLAVATDAGLEQVWIEPVVVPDLAVDGVVTVWTGGAAFSPDLHEFGVCEAKRYLSLVLRWHDQTRRLDAAAHCDELTGLANRRAIFEVLSARNGGGAVLFADLDGFKSVNDRWSHATGDALLQEVGHRLVHSVRSGDCVARLGGDEFAVAMPGVTLDEALAAADRVRCACSTPFALNGTVVTIGISVGVAHDRTCLSEETLYAADRDQYTYKRGRGRAAPGVA